MMNHLSRWIAIAMLVITTTAGSAGFASEKDEDLQQDASLSAEDHGNSPQNENYPKRINAQETPEKSTTAAGSLGNNLLTKAAIVVGILMILAIVMSSKRPQQAVPREALEVLGKVPFSGRQSLQLVRFGRKLVLVESSNDGLKPISEITDPLEVQDLLAKFQNPGN